MLKEVGKNFFDIVNMGFFRRWLDQDVVNLSNDKRSYHDPYIIEQVQEY